MKSIIERIKSTTFLTDGGLETDLIFLKNIELPHFAAFPLLDDPQYAETLKSYYVDYLEIAKKNGTGFILESPTWRGNKDWGYKLGYNENELIKVNLKAIQLLDELKNIYNEGISDILISGQIGPRGDGYQNEMAMTFSEARQYHSLQIETFKKAKVDLVSAITMTYTEEAIGIVLGSKANKLPVVISFTVETDGRLPSGETIKEAIEKVDQISGNYPVYYMINCAHPSHFFDALDGNANWKSRIKGVRANASCKSHQELDNSTELDPGDTLELGKWHHKLKN